MKTLLKISLALISISFFNCKSGDDKSENGKTDSATVAMPPDSVLMNNDNNSANFPDPADFDKETTRQINEALLSSKKEIMQLRTEISDSVTKSDHITFEKKALLSRAILQLEASTDVINKQLEDILVGDLQTSREKLNVIVKKMKGSEKELGAMIQKLDRISGYMQVATTLMQSLVHIPSTTATTPAKSSKDK